jgi:site-specific recombinase XerD
MAVPGLWGSAGDPRRVLAECQAPLLKRAGVRRRKPHALRHTFASLLFQQGESLAYVRAQMGHHSIKIPVDIYGHLVPGSNKAAVDSGPTHPPATYTQPRPRGMMAGRRGVAK